MIQNKFNTVFYNIVGEMHAVGHTPDEIKKVLETTSASTGKWADKIKYERTLLWEEIIKEVNKAEELDRNS